MQTGVAHKARQRIRLTSQQDLVLEESPSLDSWSEYNLDDAVRQGAQTISLRYDPRHQVFRVQPLGCGFRYSKPVFTPSAT